jgi:cell division protein ZapA (FtsZ GTPase activity inhibitor)
MGSSGRLIKVSRIGKIEVDVKMQVQEKISVTVTIAGRVFPLMVLPQEESIVLKAAQDINERILTLKSSFHGLDDVHLLSMHCLTLATDLLLMKQKIEAVNADLSDAIQITAAEINQTLSALQNQNGITP